jgi:hypothetical protein
LDMIWWKRKSLRTPRKMAGAFGIHTKKPTPIAKNKGWSVWCCLL